MTSMQWFGRAYRPLPAKPTRLQILERAEKVARDALNEAFAGAHSGAVNLACCAECSDAYMAVRVELHEEYLGHAH